MGRREISGNFVLDSSVLIKWFSREDDSEIALLIREGYRNGKVSITCPDLVLYELSNALRYATTFTVWDVKAALDSLFDLGIRVIVPTREVLHKSIALAKENGITVYDASFVALAVVLKFTLITADKKLYSNVRSLGCVSLLREI